jgi:hypothetical protein
MIILFIKWLNICTGESKKTDHQPMIYDPQCHSRDDMVVGYISFLYISDCSESILDTRGRHSRDDMVVGYISFLYISECRESILDIRGH